MMKIDDLIAKKLGDLELQNMRLAYAVEHHRAEVARLSALLAAKDEEIARLTEAANEPNLPLSTDASGGSGARSNGEVPH